MLDHTSTRWTATDGKSCVVFFSSSDCRTTSRPAVLRGCRTSSPQWTSSPVSPSLEWRYRPFFCLRPLDLLYFLHLTYSSDVMKSIKNVLYSLIWKAQFNIWCFCVSIVHSLFHCSHLLKSKKFILFLINVHSAPHLDRKKQKWRNLCKFIKIEKGKYRMVVSVQTLCSVLSRSLFELVQPGVFLGMMQQVFHTWSHFLFVFALETSERTIVKCHNFVN